MESGALAKSVAAVLSETVDALIRTGVHDEALGILRPERGFSVFKVAPSVQAVGRAWRLGALLVDRDGRLYATGEVTRAIEPGRAAVNRSQAGERRRAIRLAASRGPFDRGEVVNLGFRQLELDDESLLASSYPLVVTDGAVMVRWAESGDARDASPLEDYLRDRIALLEPE